MTGYIVFYDQVEGYFTDAAPVSYGIRPEHPDPGAVPETLTFRRTPAAPNGMSDVRVAIPSSLSPGAQPLYDTAMQAQLGALLFTVHDHFAANVYPQLTGLRLDVEIEVTADGRIVLKQARPYLGVEP